MSRIPAASGALILTQAAHSVEEYVGRLWESFPPARLVSAAISDNLETGFLIANVALVSFGLWCWLGPIRRGWPSARPLAWAWVTLEAVNGTGHCLWAIRQGSYTPGVATAPLLLALAIYLAILLRRTSALR
ncbi:MAG TPA: HXXEE domain-containing protein [Gemmatimonadales bacterium]